MYRLNVSNMKDREIKNALGIFEETFSYDELPPPPKSSPFDYDIFVPVFLVIVISVQLILYVLKNKEKIKII